MTLTALPSLSLLEAKDWSRMESAHHERADSMTLEHRQRASRRESHPVWDFLYTYYNYKPAIMRKWHPGAGVALKDAVNTHRADMRWYTMTADGAVALDAAQLNEARGGAIGHIASLLRNTATNSPRFDCFGMHEWAMVYKREEHRHAAPLRLGQSGTDAVVEAADLKCTHYDAFRFFTPPAVPRNSTAPTRQLQLIMEQPGCLHAGMDLYKWNIKLGPIVSGSVLLDAFQLAADIRLLDMQASPYDISTWGFAAVAVETPEGKAEYVRQQRAFAARGEQIRGAMLTSIEAWEKSL